MDQLKFQDHHDSIKKFMAVNDAAVKLRTYKKSQEIELACCQITSCQIPLHADENHGLLLTCGMIN